MVSRSHLAHLHEDRAARLVIGLKVNLARRNLGEHYSEVDLQLVCARTLVSVVSSQHQMDRFPVVPLLEVVKLDALSKVYQ